MALMKKQPSEIPPDAVLLTEKEAIQYQLDIIKDWKKKSDVWYFKYTAPILSSLTVLNSLYINNHYRIRFRLSDYGRLSSYLPVVVIPSVLSGICHAQFITSDVLIQKSCAACVETRAACIQGFFSTVFPTILAVASTVPLAVNYHTYKIPPITEEPKKVFQLLYKQTKPIGNILLWLLAVQGIAAAFLTHKQMDSLFKIHTKLNELEENLDRAHST